MDFGRGGDFLKTFLEGSVDHIIYMDYIANRLSLLTVVWPVHCATVCKE